ncbi:exosome complex exonuclease RRP46 homolog isoform X1 [Physcomitrium patens]|uniref:Exoribonuclease phosphorolytic domain-containing protein n=2 Tax=Physcomitrium patens TaxID=3218 RepID=A9T9V1_PHYPA|nr:exosome complex exonuclease RRP46 homolog [Physcomitrium patens]PNR55114.1 hypothetical protein PHYPA_006007 [Physcomitrium patens]|eukprot:XP_024373657.1 exosome complex exonuclease RRP46 homolog [Physcomitrella patens]
MVMAKVEVGAAPSLNVAERADGRSASQLRPLSLSRGLLTRAHGSATWSQENTTVLAAVYGPKPAAMKKENAERAIIEVVWRAKSGLSGSYEKDAEVVVRRSLEYIILTALHPNTAISVILQVINDDGSLLACAMNAACAALVDAGIPLNGLLSAVSCGVTHDGQVFLDPTKPEEQKCKAYVSFVFPSRRLSAVPELPADVDGEPVEYGILTSVTRGAMEVEEYFSCVENCRAAAAKVSEFSRSSIEQSLKGNRDGC